MMKERSESDPDDPMCYFTIMNPNSGKYLTGNDPPNTLTIQAQYEEDDEDDDDENEEQVTKTSVEGSSSKRTKRRKRDEPASSHNGKKMKLKGSGKSSK